MAEIIGSRSIAPNTNLGAYAPYRGSPVNWLTVNPVQTLSDEDLLLKLRGAEHDFVERKPLKQKGDWLQVAVAFANSAPIGGPAVLFVCVDDQGNPQQGPEKLEDLAKSVTGTLDWAYPPIYRDIRPLHVAPDKACLAVIIPGSENRPHFAGKSYVRVGPEVREAPEDQFEELVASRLSKLRELQKWISKTISAANKDATQMGYSVTFHGANYKVFACNPHYVTIGEDELRQQSHPLSTIEIGYDHRHQRLLVYFYNDR